MTESRLSWAGVDLFFVLSGFLIGGLLIDNRRAQNYFINFYVRRAARILPPYLLLIVAYLIVSAFFTINETAKGWLFDDCPSVGTCLLFLQNFWMGIEGTHGGNWLGVTWSLAIEEQAYLLLPLVVRFFPIRALPWIMGALILSAPLFRSLLILQDESRAVAAYVWPHCRWDGIAFGVFGAWIVREKRLDGLRAGLVRRWRYFLLLSMTGILALTLTNQNIGSFGMAVAGHTWLSGSGLLIIILAFTSPTRWLQMLLTQPLLTWLGTISYGSYLFHQPVSGLVHGWLRADSPAINDLSDFFVSCFALIITLFLAQFSWWMMESRILSLARRSSYHN